MGIIISKDGKYYIDEEHRMYPSSTTILRELSPLQGVPQAFLEEAGNIGTIAHENIALLATGWKITSDNWFELPQQSRNSIIAYDRLRKELHFHPEEAELQIINHVEGYGCTLDLVGRVPAGRVIWENKTATELHAINVLQVASYYMAYITEYPKRKLIGGILAHLDKVSGRPHPYFIPAIKLEQYFISFRIIKELSYHMNEARNIIEGEENWKIQKITQT